MDENSVWKWASFAFRWAGDYGLLPRIMRGFKPIVSVTSALVIGLLTQASAVKAGVGLVPFAEGFVSPSNLVPLKDKSGRLLLSDQSGTISVLSKDGKVAEKLFLDLRPKLCKLNEGFDERGILGLAVHPKFPDVRKVYVVYSAPKRAATPADWDHTMTLSQFNMGTGEPAEADAASEKVVLQIDKPYFNHNAGAIAFGPDGLLYVSVGDGGNGKDEGIGHAPEGNGQNKDTLLGKILRIDVDHGDPYSIPQDNPYAKGGGKPEIFAIGLRNSWRMSFDTGGKQELFAADVGQDAFEEVNIIRKGANYGWKVREGLAGFDPKEPTKPPQEAPKTDADGKPFADPVVIYKNFKAFPKDPESKGVSITGGFVYRGKAIPSLQGRYVFGDWTRSWVMADGAIYVADTTLPQDKPWPVTLLDLSTHPKHKLGFYIVAFGQDEEGELYVLTNPSNGLGTKKGRIFKLVPKD